MYIDCCQIHPAILISGILKTFLEREREREIDQEKTNVEFLVLYLKVESMSLENLKNMMLHFSDIRASIYVFVLLF
jgi:hypothetical protein